MAMQNAVYKIFPEKGIYILSFYGSITLHDILELMKNVRGNDNFKVEMNGIADFRKACFIFKESDVESYVDFADKTNGIKGRRKVALITSTPQQTTYSLLYKALAGRLPMAIEVFTTIESGMDWADIPREYFSAINMHLMNAEMDYNKALV